jgi:thiamine-phosphate pyrophosphorylase
VWPAHVPRLYAIADRDALAGRSLPAVVGAMASAGVRWIQVRAKGASGGDLYSLVEDCLRALEGSGATLWVDDRADVAALLPVGGVHLGQQDLPPASARLLLPPSLLVGASTHDLAQAAAAAADPAVDVTAVGPVFATAGKRHADPVVGLELVREARRLTDKPLVAIGGIDAGNLAAVLAAGADTVAVLSAACRGEPGASCRALLAAAEAA